MEDLLIHEQVNISLKTMANNKSRGTDGFNDVYIITGFLGSD